MSLNNGDKARDNRQRRAKLAMREKVRAMRQASESKAEKTKRGK